MTEEEARAVVERMRRQAWGIGLGALATSLVLVAFNILWGSMWWLPLNLISLAVAAWNIRKLIADPR